MTTKFTLIALSFFVVSTLSAATGDTAKVTTHQKVVIKTNPSVGHTRYSAWGQFPGNDKKYRKVYLYLEFGCAPGLTCGEWDYINNIYLGRKGGVKGDSLYYELARFITPYGKSWTAASNWKHGWYFDLTDFSYLMHDSLEIIYQHTGYEANNDRGWTVTLQFNCIEGTPALEPLGVTRFYEVSAPFGSASNAFKNAVPDKTFTVADNADFTRFKTIQTGHGMDQQENCAEFCSKQRTIKLDNSEIDKRSVWRDNCGLNSLYPQAGTWLYDRAGWCPGAPVEANDVDVKLAANSQHTFSLDMESYTNSVGGSANYYISAYAMYFKDNRKQRDAAIDDILAPSTHFDYLRMNPECGAPILNIKNFGLDTIKTVYFEYGKLGGQIQFIEVHCNIASMQSGIVNLEAIYNWSGSGNTFYAKILKVNNQSDENDENNLMYSTIINTVTWPNKIIVTLKTNNAASENYYRITDAKGNIIKQRNNMGNNITYRDTVQLMNNICYKFELLDDGTPPASNPLNKDGLGWWANVNDGTGSLQIRSGLNNALLKSFNVDFGTKIMHNFYTTFPMGVPPLTNQIKESILVQVYPNPATSSVNLTVDFKESGPANISIYDNLGRLVYSTVTEKSTETIDVNNLASGLYHVVVNQGAFSGKTEFIVN
ncbi:MAG: peptide-N-glycosidase F-related protein [Bacteroidota bacterium]